MIKGLSYDCTETELRNFLSTKVTDHEESILSVKILMDKHTKKCRGTCFINLKD